MRAALLRRLGWLLLLAVAPCGCGVEDGDGRDDVDRSAALVALEVSGAATPLNPPFDPLVHRYSVVADDSPEDLSLEASAPRSYLISVDGAITASDIPVSLATLQHGRVVTIEVHTRLRDSSEPAVYEVVYLPPDFPQLIVTTHTPEVSTDPLYVNLNGSRAFYVAILDNHGVPFFYRRESEPVFDFKWHAATGERSYLRQTGARNRWGRQDAEAVILDSDFNEIDAVKTVGLSHTDVHDFLITPHGELVLIAYDGARRDLTAFGLGAADLVEESVVQVLDRATRQVSFQWNSWGAIPFDDQIGPTRRAEYAHVNSVIEDRDGSLIVSARGTSQVIKIARPSGLVVWKLGGRSNQFVFRDDPFPHLCGQHSVTRLESGNLLVFDNGQNCWPAIAERGRRTRVVEYRLDEDRLEATLVWSYEQDGAFSAAQGSAQRLPNGNTLIGWGTGPRMLATEVNARGEKVFEIVAYDRAGAVESYRAARYPR